MKTFGNLFLMTLLCVAIFVVFMGIRPAPAGWQGNLPTPVQSLPAYPPVTCVAPDWATEPCEDRQTPLPRSNPLRAFGLQKRTPSKTKTVLYDEHGGVLNEHIYRWRRLAESGDDVEIRGPCMSGCTMIVAIVPADRICFAEHASLQFHSSRDQVSGVPGDDTNRWMFNQYPQDIREWIKTKGGIEKLTIFAMWKLDAEELWSMGYRKCEPDPPPVPMTEISTRRISAPGATSK
jgi:hypothetical protein